MANSSIGELRSGSQHGIRKEGNSLQLLSLLERGMSKTPASSRTPISSTSPSFPSHSRHTRLQAQLSKFCSHGLQARIGTISPISRRQGYVPQYRGSDVPFPVTSFSVVFAEQEIARATSEITFSTKSFMPHSDSQHCLYQVSEKLGQRNSDLDLLGIPQSPPGGAIRRKLFLL